MRLNKCLLRVSARHFTETPSQNTNKQIVTKNVSRELPFKQFQDKFNFPLKIGGMKNIQEEKPSFIFNQMLNYSKMSKNWILDHLQKIYLGTLYSIEKNDKEFLEEYLEPSLANKLFEQISNLQDEGYRVR